jgi:flavodoxin
MKVLNLYYSATGNTDRVAEQIERAVREAGHEVETIKAAKGIELDILAYDFAFIGSGVYPWLRGGVTFNRNR